jgi:hypothetical protein
MKHILKFFLLLLLASCSREIIAPGKIVGQKFPKVNGQSLDQKKYTIPDDLLGQKTLLLIGYKQKTQFDIDRWILGVLQADIKVKIIEIPTIAGMMPSVVQNFIDSGMRRGIPKEDWSSVVTVYEDADKIIAALGNERPQSAYAVVLDEQGNMIWSSNRGYSAGQVLELKRFLDNM